MTHYVPLPINKFYDEMVASAARTTNGNSGPLPGYGALQDLVVQVDASAVSGTSPSLTVLVEDTVDGTNYNTVQAFTAITAVGRQVQRITVPFTDTLRVSWTITGTTPSFTFSVKCVAGTRSPINRA